MMKPPIIFVLAAGKSVRMGMPLPKVMLDLGGRPMGDYAIEVAQKISGSDVIVVVSPETDQKSWGLKAARAFQEQPTGTSKAFEVAFRLAQQTISDFWDRDILVLLGDAPLIQKQDLEGLLEEKGDCILMGMYPPIPEGYGRILCEGLVLGGGGSKHRVRAIVESKNANAEEKKILFCYSGVMKIKARLADILLKKVQPNPLTNEYYLTDFVHLAKDQGVEIHCLEGRFDSFAGINTRQEFVASEELLQKRFREKAFSQGALLKAPETVFLSYDTQMSPGVFIESSVWIGPGVILESNVQIYSFCRLSLSHIRAGSKVGPFAHLRQGVTLGQDTCVGNFVELKNSHLGDMTQVKHLSYLGDSTLGAKVNIGACVVTCNFDGYQKSPTFIRDHCFIGSHTSIVAPVVVEEKSTVGAGSVITQDVPACHLALSRGRQVNKPLAQNSKHLMRCDQKE
jgi:bifunctional UDP-N-acetylglucosamine pyrophosphorylase / glucosamine-1-phosphate N-acetyltransferase